MTNTLKTLTSHKSDEHNTPSYIIEAAREVLGIIDLDPMSNTLANKTVKATKFYTKEDNGLAKDWYGRVWLNPPFSLAKSAIPKLIESYKSGQIEEAVLLIKSDVSTQNYKLLYPYPFCELNRRVKFENVDNKDSAPFPVVLFYLGRKYYKWNNTMWKLGKVHPGNDLFTSLAMRCNIDELRSLGVIE
jgi:DNA N-6-adenine-methyltransferase (Dam).